MATNTPITEAEHQKMQQDAKRIALAIGGVCMVSLLIVTLIKLIPLGEQNSDAKGDFNDAKNAYDAASKALTAAKQALTDANQRIADLNCAIDGYPAFNGHVNTFKEQIEHSSGSDTDKLSKLWQVNLTPNHHDHNVHKDVLNWVETKRNYEYDYYWSCFHTSCHDDDDTCCYAWDWHWVTKKIKHPYTKAIITDSDYNNIVTSNGFALPDLSCGTFSRSFGLGSASNVLAHHTESTSGAPQSGYVETDIHNTYASQLNAQFALDGADTQQLFKTNPDISASAVASQLASGLLQFLASAAIKFASTGQNYPTLKQQTQDSIPSLLAKIGTATDALAQAKDVMDAKKVIADTINAPYHHALNTWLPTLFLVPCAAAVVAGVASYYFMKYRREQQDATAYHAMDDNLTNKAIGFTAGKSSNEELPPPPPATAPPWPGSAMV